MSDHLCYLRVSGIYVHENCCLGVQRHPPTYMERRRFQDGPETMFQMGVTHMWYLVSVTGAVCSRVALDTAAQDLGNFTSLKLHIMIEYWFKILFTKFQSMLWYDFAD